MEELDFKPMPDVQSDPFAPVLYVSPPLNITTEQRDQCRRVLQLTSADSSSAIKAADALETIMAGGINGGVVPNITSLSPASGTIGTNVKLRCLGTGFDASCIIYVNGNPKGTTYVSANEVFTNLNLNGVAPGTVQVSVLTGQSVLSNSMTFTIV